MPVPWAEDTGRGSGFAILLGTPCRPDQEGRTCRTSEAGKHGLIDGSKPPAGAVVLHEDGVWGVATPVRPVAEPLEVYGGARSEERAGFLGGSTSD